MCARSATHPDFKVRLGLDAPRLAELFRWTAAEFDARMRGSAIYRIGYERWSRNIAVALGNALASESDSESDSEETRAALHSRKDDASALVREHVVWALGRHPELAEEPTGQPTS